MSKRLVFCVETTKQADTDYSYIIDTIQHYYVLSSQTVLRQVYMESKTRYNSKSVQEDIRRQSGRSDTSVIYCIDTDDYDISAETKTLLDQIKEYCKTNGYDFIFFCRDVEDVYHGKRICKKDKVQAVRRFRSAHVIETITTGNLQRKNYQVHCSNILNVLDKYLTRKEQ